MRWEDERYVRFYTRNTPEWLALSWQARSLFGLILREVDRAGVLKLGRLGLKGVAVAVTAPWAEVSDALKELLEDGCVRFDAERGVLWMPNYIEAQEAKSSDAARKRASRERARAVLGATVDPSAKASQDVTVEAPADGQQHPPATTDIHPPDGTPPDQKARPVTQRDRMVSRAVTEPGHVVQDAVTRGHSVLNRTVPSRTDPPKPPEGVGGDGSPSGERRFALGTPGLVEAEAAYRDGIAEGLGRPVALDLGLHERTALISALNTHFAREPSKLDAIAALGRSAEAWVRDCTAHGKADFTRGWSPRKFVEWLNTTGVPLRAPAKSGVSLSTPAPEEPPLSQEELAAELQRFRDAGAPALLLEVLGAEGAQGK